MRNLISLLLAALLPLSAFASADVNELPGLHALSAVLMAGDGEVLFEQESDRMLPIASTTKIMTALVVIENCELDETVEIQPAWCGIEGSSIYLKPGDRYTVRELLLGLLLASGNDAATALACHCAGDIEAFSELMNRRVKELGMASSHFMNPHGLNEAGHYSTAHDLAMLMLEAMKNEKFSELIGMEKAQLGNETIVNHNKLLYRYPGCIGGKTGYTEVAGRCLVSCVEKEDLRLVCVTLNDPDDWNDHAKLYDWGYSHFMMCVVNADNTRLEIPLLGGRVSAAVAVPATEVKTVLPRDSEAFFKAELPFFTFAPVSRGAAAGQLLLQDGEGILADIPLVYCEDYPIQ